MFAEHGAAGDFSGDGAEDEDGGVEPEDGGDGGGEPGVDEVVVGVEVAAGLGDEEDADEGDEEHEVAAEGEEEADAGLGEAFAGAAAAARAVVPVVAIAFAVAAGALVGGRAVSVVAVADAMAINLRRCDGGRHGRMLLSDDAVRILYSASVLNVLAGFHWGEDSCRNRCSGLGRGRRWTADRLDAD